MVRGKHQRRYLMLEIVEEILCKLPVKSLNRFRSVSTSWQSLISSNRFIRKHLMSAESALFQKTLIHHEYLNTLPLYSLDTMNIAYPGYHLQQDPKFSFWRGTPSCDGLICIEDAAPDPEFLFVWNPCMRIFKHIPNYSIGYPLLLEGTYCFGIGYDATRDDYKIMKLSKRWPSDTSKTEIYSLKTDSWTRADDFPGDISFGGCESVFLNGAIHWLDAHNKSIFSFDLSRNKYKEIPLPKYELKNKFFQKIKPAAFRGMLYVLVNDTSDLILWGLKGDYRDQNSWTRMLAIPLMVVADGLRCLLVFKLLYVYENGEFLIGAAEYSGKTTEMIVCKDRQIIFRQITPHNPYVIRDGIVQVENLISLGLDGKIVM